MEDKVSPLPHFVAEDALGFNTIVLFVLIPCLKIDSTDWGNTHFSSKGKTVPVFKEFTV